MCRGDRGMGGRDIKSLDMRGLKRRFEVLEMDV